MFESVQMMITNYVLTWDNSTSYAFLVMAIVKKSSMLSHPNLFSLIHGIEFLFLVPIVLIIWYFALTLERRQLYHKNIVRIIQFNYLSYYITVVARVVTFLYEIELFPTTGTLADWPLLLSSFLRLQFVVVFIFLIPSITAERCFASYYIVDYEQLSRGWISTVIIIATVFTTLSFVIPIMRGFFGIELFAVLFILVVVFVVLFISVFKFNSVKLTNLNKHYHKKERYSLSIRFQLSENVRTMKHLVIIAFILAVAICIALYLIAGAVIWADMYSIEGQVSAALFEMWISIAAAIVLVSFEIVNSQFQKGNLAIFGTTPSRYLIAEQIGQSKDSMTQIHFNTLTQFW